MKTKICSLFLVVSLLFAMSAVGLAATPAPFGRELTPLTEEEMAQIEGEGLLQIGVGGLVGGVQYLIVTPYSDWNARAGLKHVLAGALGAWAGGLF